MDNDNIPSIRFLTDTQEHQNIIYELFHYHGLSAELLPMPINDAWSINLSGLPGCNCTETCNCCDSSGQESPQ